MAEFGISNFIGINDVDGYKKGIGSKPLLLFHGEQWESDATYSKLQNLFVDLFRGDCPDKVALKGIDHVLSFNIIDGVISFRAYTVSMKKSGTKVPDALLQTMGPSFDLTLRRHNFAHNDLWNIAVKKPKQLKFEKKKNIKRTDLGETLGRIHIEKQDLDKATGKLMHVLRNRNPKSKSKESA
jgi:ribosome production factor 2